MGPQGWYSDPYGSHDDRWFSSGRPTSLVRDQGAESYDEPPGDSLLPFPVEREAGEQLPSAPTGRTRAKWRAWAAWLPDLLAAEWPAWTVWLPGLLTLAFWGSLAFGQASLFIVAVILIIGPLAAGLAIPAWRPGMAAILWAEFVLSWAWILLFLRLIFHAISGLT
jgi:hypothetical protein